MKKIYLVVLILFILIFLGFFVLRVGSGHMPGGATGGFHWGAWGNENSNNYCECIGFTNAKYCFGIYFNCHLGLIN